jgi:2-polyprenyl-3-methyl-5-hydroxy-6-metoxy-1,4-benzoquinol methylase
MDDYTLVNLEHPQQDVHRVRRDRTGHIRYRLAEQLLPALEPGTPLLEVGCGRSEFARRLRALGQVVTVTDLNPTNIEFARTLGFAAHQLDLNRGLPPFVQAQFAGVVMLEVIEHVVSAELLLQDIYRVLRPGGFLILSTPNFAFWPNRLRILMGQLSMDEGYHYRFFTVKSLTRQLITVGFKVDAWRFIMPAFGINRMRRQLQRSGRKHVPIPKLAAPLFAQTMMVRCYK